MSTRHTTELYLEVFGIERTLEVDFSFTPGEPERGPSYDSGGEPASGPEIEIIAVRVQLPPPKGAKSMTAEGGAWLEDTIQKALAEGGIDMEKFTDAVGDAEAEAAEARAEARRDE